MYPGAYIFMFGFCAMWKKGRAGAYAPTHGFIVTHITIWYGAGLNSPQTILYITHCNIKTRAMYIAIHCNITLHIYVKFCILKCARGFVNLWFIYVTRGWSVYNHAGVLKRTNYFYAVPLVPWPYDPVLGRLRAGGALTVLRFVPMRGCVRVLVYTRVLERVPS